RVGERVYAERVRGRTFAVRARRSGLEAFRTRDVMVQLGAALDRYGDVNLDHPDVTVFVETRDGEALFFSDHVAGAGGLPLGAEGRAVCLFSGGFDSPVAAWLLLKRGVALDYVFCNLGGEAYERSVVSVAKILADRWSHGYRPVLHASPQAVDDEESRVNLAVLDAAVAARKRLDLRALTATDLVQPYLFAADIPDGAVVLDCREPQSYEAWHWPGAERRDPVDLAERFPALDKTRRYILYCSLGLHSAYLAEA